MNTAQRMLATAGTLAATLVLGACGGGGGGGGGGAPPASRTTADGTATVGVRQVAGLGRVLVDASGKALYSADVEAGGKVRCLEGCTSFWSPLTVSSGRPGGGPGVGKLGVVRRPDGMRQVTADGRLLYTFSQDSPGHVRGDGFSDDFGGRHFTWTAVRAGGASAGTGGGASGAAGRNDYGY